MSYPHFMSGYRICKASAYPTFETANKNYEVRQAKHFQVIRTHWWWFNTKNNLQKSSLKSKDVWNHRQHYWIGSKVFLLVVTSHAEHIVLVTHISWYIRPSMLTHSNNSVAQSDIQGRFAWQAWHKLTSTIVLRGRRGTIWHPRSFCVAGASLMALGGALGPGLVARDARGAAQLLRGRRGTWWHPPWFHVAGVAQSHIHCRFAWQVPHSWHWVAPLGPV